MYQSQEVQQLQGPAELVLPQKPPADVETAERIRKLSTYVARNGLEFENKVREKEATNPLFDFLTNLECKGHQYYLWSLFCAERKYNEEEVRSIEKTYVNQLLRATPGCIDLTEGDKQSFQALLKSNTGSKDAIKSLRRWIIERAHSSAAIGIALRDYAKNLDSEPQPETLESSKCKNKFDRLLHIAYVLNDVFYNSKDVQTTPGAYTEAWGVDPQCHSSVNIIDHMVENLKVVLRIAYESAQGQPEREKLTRLITLWKNKNFIDAARCSQLMSALSTSVPIDKPPAPQLVSPFLSPDLIPVSEAVRMQEQLKMQALQSMARQQLQQQHQQQPGFLPPAPPMYPPQPGFPSNAPPVHAHYSYMPPNAGPMLGPPGIDRTAAAAPNPNGFLPLAGGGYPFNQAPSPGLPQMTTPFLPNQNHIQAPQSFFPAVQNHPQLQPAMKVGGQSSSVLAALLPMLDLGKISVGNMVNMVKAALKMGHPKYFPIDVSTITHATAPHIEPGRLDARVAEFYRKREKLKEQPGDHAAAGTAASVAQQQQMTASSRGTGIESGVVAGSVQRKARSGSFGADDSADRVDRPVKREGWERHVLSAHLHEEGVDELLGIKRPATGDAFEGSSSSAYNKKLARTAAMLAVTGGGNGSGVDGALGREAKISEENVGHKLLRGFGWQEGSGLGSELSGRVEPVRGQGKTSRDDRTGIGAPGSSTGGTGGGLGDDGGINFETYRKILSTEYHIRSSGAGEK